MTFGGIMAGEAEPGHYFEDLTVGVEASVRHIGGMNVVEGEAVIMIPSREAK
jgi:hypothetical protein